MTRRHILLGFGALGLFGCSSESSPTPTGTSQQAVTYWEHVEPIFEQRCLGCHREGGIGPFRLDDYGTAKAHAESIRQATKSRAMPPWSITSDGTCGQFADSEALTNEQIATIDAWVAAGAAAGTAKPVTLPQPKALTGAVDLLTPKLTPTSMGTQLAHHDEYRCYVVDHPVSGFITGYDVVPGTPEIVHHAVAFVVDPEAPSGLAGKKNLEVMQALDAESPDREGWPCFGMAGDNVAVKSVPVIWAPGQGVVDYPNQSGIPLKPTDKLVVQMHYNLANPANVGKSDQTTLKLRIEPDVPNVGIFVLWDPLLNSLDSAKPDLLEAGKASVKYTWTATGREMGFVQPIPGLQLQGLMPHMHGFGRKYQFTLGEGAAASTCAGDVPRWDFNWQRMYFYQTPYAFGPDSRVQVTCDFDTSSRAEPVSPGWGTDNEMCLATMYFTVPKASLPAP